MKLNKEQLEAKLDFMKSYKAKVNPATASATDPNANIIRKNISTMEVEMYKAENKQINRALLREKITELYGAELAEEYNRQVENREIYPHDETSLKPYCCSLNIFPLLTGGMTLLDGESKAPKNLKSFCGIFINMLFANTSYFAGAVATVEFLMYFDHFARLEYGEDYMENLKEKDKYDIEQFFQQVVYSINQPAMARSYQSIFWNLSIFDKPYFESLFGDFVFPDGDKPKYKSLDGLQRLFMKWFNKEREKALLTFPVVTAAMLVDDKKPVDENFEDFIAEEMEEGNAFFIYQSKSVDSLSSCCFSGKQKCLTKSSNGVNYMTFKELSESKYNDTKKNFTIFHNGSWVKGKEVKLPADRKMYKIKTSNNKEFILSDNHINPTINGDIETKYLKVGDKLLFNTNQLDTFPEKDEGLTYEQGFAIGAFLGDGSFGTRTKNGIFEINYSLGEKKIEEVENNINKANFSLGGKNIGNIGKSTNNNYPFRISSKELVTFIQKWTNWEEGTLAYNKKINLNCLLQSKEFRKGILDGWYKTDGGNSNRCYTTSQELAENMEVLITSLGMNSIIDITDRTDEKVIIRGEEFNRNYPLFCVRWYDTKNKRSMGDVYTYKNNSIYFNIISIEEISYKEESIYCFEIDNKDEEYFTLPNGLITHNCRLRSELTDNTFSYSLGAGGVSTGSINVITINFNRLIQDGRDLRTEIDKIHKYQLAYREIIKDWIEAGFLAPYDAGFISLDKQFLTIGINGMAEAAESIGVAVGNNKKYKDFVNSQLKVIYDANRKIREETGIMFNTEFVPAEGLGVKNKKWDEEDGYITPDREAYNSYFYIVEDGNTDVIDKFILHGEDNVKYLDGGSALHLNLEEYLSKDNAKNLLRIAATAGCNYFCTNVKITICNECGNIDKRTLFECPKCGSRNIDYGTRIIGYLKRISNFAEDRQVEADKRFYHIS